MYFSPLQAKKTTWGSFECAFFLGTVSKAANSSIWVMLYLWDIETQVTFYFRGRYVQMTFCPSDVSLRYFAREIFCLCTVVIAFLSTFKSCFLLRLTLNVCAIVCICLYLYYYVFPYIFCPPLTLSLSRAIKWIISNNYQSHPSDLRERLTLSPPPPAPGVQRGDYSSQSVWGALCIVVRD